MVEKLANAAFAARLTVASLVLDLRGSGNGGKDTTKARRGATAWQLADVLLRQPVIGSNCGP